MATMTTQSPSSLPIATHTRARTVSSAHLSSPPRLRSRRPHRSYDDDDDDDDDDQNDASLRAAGAMTRAKRRKPSLPTADNPPVLSSVTAAPRRSLESRRKGPSSPLTQPPTAATSTDDGAVDSQQRASRKRMPPRDNSPPPGTKATTEPQKAEYTRGYLKAPTAPVAAAAPQTTPSSNGAYTNVTLAPIDSRTVQHDAPPPTSAQATTARRTKTNQRNSAPNPPDGESSLTPVQELPGVTKNRAKFLNGIRHELGRLNPPDADKKVEDSDGRRKLRSTENSRFKSELSQFFPEYDQIIGNDPLEQHLVELDAPAVLVDSHPLPKSAATTAYPFRSWPDDRVMTIRNGKYNSIQVVDLSLLAKRAAANPPATDPLDDSLYEPHHRRIDRQEKNVRNIEKGRAQQDKSRIDGLLQDLEGQNWLKILGVTGVQTPAKLAKYAPQREYFIRACRQVLEKFRVWADHEKRARHGKMDTGSGSRSGSRSAGPDGGKANGGKRRGEGGKGHPRRAKRQKLEVEDSDADVDASPERQLLGEEYAARGSGGKARHAGGKTGGKTGGRKLKSVPEIKAEPEPAKPVEFTSFFEKAYQRDAALKHRGGGGRRARHLLAFGQPVPEMEEKEFELPDDLLDEEVMKALERRRRVARRERRDAAASGRAVRERESRDEQMGLYMRLISYARVQRAGEPRATGSDGGEGEVDDGRPRRDSAVLAGGFGRGERALADTRPGISMGRGRGGLLPASESENPSGTGNANSSSIGRGFRGRNGVFMKQVTRDGLSRPMTLMERMRFATHGSLTTPEPRLRERRTR